MGELLIMLVIVLVIFGAGKLPQVGKSLGQAITEFKTSVKPEDKDDSEKVKTDTKEAAE
jgi:sec-independent protein translocase protein TatA